MKAFVTCVLIAFTLALHAQDIRPEPSPSQLKMMQIARDHMAAERRTQPMGELKEAENLYQKASKDLGSKEADSLLKEVIRKYPHLNRAGCAQLYFARNAKGEEREILLKEAIDRFFNCYYGDGVQVGPYAMYLLAHYYESLGRDNDARRLLSRLRSDHPDAVDHAGKLLSL